MQDFSGSEFVFYYCSIKYINPTTYAYKWLVQLKDS